MVFAGVAVFAAAELFILAPAGVPATVPLLVLLAELTAAPSPPVVPDDASGSLTGATELVGSGNGFATVAPIQASIPSCFWKRTVYRAWICL